MAKVTKFTPKICRMVDMDISQALMDVRRKWGIEICVKCGGTYTEDTFTTKLKVSIAGVDIAKRDWDNYCYRFGLTPDQYGKTFIQGGVEYTACGIKPKGKKYHVVGTNDQGKKFKFPATVLGGLD